MADNSVVVSSTTPSGQLVDKDGKATYALLKWMQSVGKTVNGGFDQQGNYQGPIGAQATIVGRKYLATIVQHLSTAGVIDPAGLPAATDTEQGAVQLPPGQVGNVLGSAAFQPSGAFDAAGSAAAAQTAASAHADTVAGTAQSNAEAFATSSIAAAFAPGITASITTAKLTALGTQGSMDFVNGLLVGQVQAT
jgi:hypothetical protein